MLNKKPAISINTAALGDTIASIPTIRKISKAYETPITVFTSFPDLFQNHPYVKEAFPINAPKEEYNVLNTFTHIAGKTHNLNGNKVQFKYAHTDSRQFHALSLGFTLLPEEMETDLYVEENWEVNFKDYVVIHPTHTWPARTWSQDKWQDLVYKLNSQNIPVIAIGKESIEHGNGAVYNKTVMDIDIPYGINLMDNPESTLPKVRNLIKKAKGIITMDSGILHLAGTTDTHIIQLGFNANPKFRAPYRKATQDYKYTYVKGSCDLECASSLKYNLKVHGHIQETPPVATCLEQKPTFECHPKVKDVVDAIVSLYKCNPPPQLNKIFIFDEDGVKVSISDESPSSYNVKFFNHTTNELVYKTTIQNGMWAKPSIKYHIKWRVEVWQFGKLIFSNTLNLTNK